MPQETDMESMIVGVLMAIGTAGGYSIMWDEGVLNLLDS